MGATGAVSPLQVGRWNRLFPPLVSLLGIVYLAAAVNACRNARSLDIGQHLLHIVLLPLILHVLLVKVRVFSLLGDLEKRDASVARVALAMGLTIVLLIGGLHLASVFALRDQKELPYPTDFARAHAVILCECHRGLQDRFPATAAADLRAEYRTKIAQTVGPSPRLLQDSGWGGRLGLLLNELSLFVAFLNLWGVFVWGLFPPTKLTARLAAGVQLLLCLACWAIIWVPGRMLAARYLQFQDVIIGPIIPAFVALGAMFAIGALLWGRLQDDKRLRLLAPFGLVLGMLITAIVSDKLNLWGYLEQLDIWLRLAIPIPLLLVIYVLYRSLERLAVEVATPLGENQNGPGPKE
jgi:hypothetical protein